MVRNHNIYQTFARWEEYIQTIIVLLFSRYLTWDLIWHLSQSSIRPSVYFSSIVKSRSNPFLESTSIKQWSFLLKEITGSFDGVRTYECQITSQTRYPLRRPSGQVSYMTCYSVHIFYQKMCFLNVCTWTTLRHLWIRVYVYHVHTY